MYSVLIRRIGIPIAERLKGWPVSKYLTELQQSQWWTPEQIRELQNQKLRELVEHAYQTVPYYRELMDAGGLTPNDIASVDDLGKLPILTKEVIRANYPEKMVSTAAAGELMESTSSGSTGEPFRYKIDADEKARKWAGLFRFWTWSGYEVGSRWVNLTASPPRAFKHSGLMQRLESRFSGILGLPANELYSSNADHYMEQITNFKPTMLRGYTSSLHYLALKMREKGITMQTRAVCTTGETLFEFQREVIESFFGCKVYDGYGGEGMEIAGQCGCGNNYHVNAEGVILEIVDSQGNPCPAGKEGQIVLTDLNHYSMPFIRYNIQDMGVMSDQRCECGRGLPVLERISGRLTDVGVTPSGKSIVVHFFTGMFMQMAPKVRTFQVIQERPDLFTILVVPGPEYETVQDEIARKTRDYLGDDVQLEVKLVESIPTTIGGKRRLFISKCGIPVAGLKA